MTNQCCVSKFGCLTQVQKVFLLLFFVVSILCIGFTAKTLFSDSSMKATMGKSTETTSVEKSTQASKDKESTDVGDLDSKVPMKILSMVRVDNNSGDIRGGKMKIEVVNLTGKRIKGIKIAVEAQDMFGETINEFAYKLEAAIEPSEKPVIIERSVALNMFIEKEVRMVTAKDVKFKVTILNLITE